MLFCLTIARDSFSTGGPWGYQLGAAGIILLTLIFGVASDMQYLRRRDALQQLLRALEADDNEPKA